MVIDGRGPIAEIELPSLRVRYHVTAGPPRPRHTPTRVVTWQTVWKGDSLFAGVENDTSRLVRLIDTRSWSTKRTIKGPGSCRLLRDLFLCDGSDGAQHTLAAYGFDGRKRWSQALAGTFWDVRLGRLFAGTPDIVELDPNSGHRIRTLGRMTLWNAELRSWVPSS